jgi:hypothetical protein
VLLRVAKASAAEKGDEVKRSAQRHGVSCRNGGFQWDISID